MGESLEHPIFTMQEFFELHEELLRLTQHHDIVTISWHLRHADWFCAFTLQPIEPPSRHRSEWDLSCTMRRPTWIVMNRHLHYISRAKHLQQELLLTKLSIKGSGGYRTLVDFLRAVACAETEDCTATLLAHDIAWRTHVQIADCEVEQDPSSLDESCVEVISLPKEHPCYMFLQSTIWRMTLHSVTHGPSCHPASRLLLSHSPGSNSARLSEIPLHGCEVGL